MCVRVCVCVWDFHALVFDASDFNWKDKANLELNLHNLFQ